MGPYTLDPDVDPEPADTCDCPECMGDTGLSTIFVDGEPAEDVSES